MKQEASKKNKKWIWLVAGLAALLVVVGVVLAFTIPGQSGGGHSANGRSDAELYWNIDRKIYTENAEVEGLSMREPAEDGNYYIRFAYKGEQVELSIIDKQLVNWIDTMDLVGLIKDADGVVVDAVDPKEVATETARSFYVRKVNGNEIIMNSSYAMNGMPMTITCTDNTGIYNVDPKAEVVGAITEVGIMDQLLVYSNEEEEVTHIYITERAPVADIYWRLERKYNSSTASTTRVPDENGVYTIEFALDGEHVALKTKDVSLVNYVDSLAPLTAAFAPLFDDEGYIVEFVNVAIALRGQQLCNDYHITAIDGDTITATRLSSGADQGNVVTFTINDACKVYLTCDGCYENCVGEKITELQLNDRFNLWTDLDGNPILMFVTRRMVDSPVYYNLERLYAGGKTTREPDANGYYVFKMAASGKAVTLRTKDVEIATEIDKQSICSVGLKVNGDIIERVYPLSCVTGSGDYGSNRYVTMQSGPVFEATYYNDFSNKANVVMAADCKIYDVTTGFYGVEVGEETTINLYDKITYIKNLYGEASTIFVLDRYVDLPIYYNLSRKYSSQTESTTRVPDADGYYVYDMICEGKTVQVKTKSKSIASFIDKQNSPFAALSVSGGIVQKAYPAAAAIKYGYKTANYHYIKEVNSDGSFKTYYIINGVRHESSYNFKMTDDCVVYDLSNAYDSYKGEKTKLRVGDQIQAFACYPAAYPNSDIAEIYILNRKLNSPMYKNVEQMYNWTTKETAREPNADGWYVFDLAANGEIKQYKTKDKAIATQVDSYELGFTLVTDGDIITRVCASTMCPGVSNSVAPWYDVMTLDGKKASLFCNKPDAANYGKAAEVEYAEDCVFYDFSPHAEKYGAVTELSVGDRVHNYINAEGKVVICFVLSKNTHEEGHVSYCQHCDQEVFWNPYTGAGTNKRDAHFYVTHDGRIKYQGNIGTSTDPYDIVLDLNGHTMTTANRSFMVYGTLNIIDTVGGGGIVAGNGTGVNGGCIYINNEGVVNLYDGVIATSGTGKVGQYGGVVYAGNGCTFNMYGGKVTGGSVSNTGGNVMINSGGTLNMVGGTISGGSADSNGGNLYAGKNTTINIGGGTISGDVFIAEGCNLTLSGAPVITDGEIYSMRITKGVLAGISELDQKASIMVSGDGAFTAEFDKAADYLDCFEPEKATDSIVAENNSLHYVKTVANYNGFDNSDLVFDAGTTDALCPVCNKKVTWVALSGDAAVTLENKGHYYLAADVTYEGAEQAFITAPDGGRTACFHLNGHNITATAHRAIQGNASVLNIMGNGTVSGSYNANKLYGATINMEAAYADGTLNLIGGTYTKNAACNVSPNVVLRNGGDVNLYDGAEIVGVDNVANVQVYFNCFNVYGGKVYGGTGNQVVTSNWTATCTGTFTMTGGVIDGNVTIQGSSDKDGGCSITGGTINGQLTIARYTHSTIGGVTINGQLYVGRNATNDETSITLTGAPVITGTGMSLPAGFKLTLDEMSEDAQILLTADGVFAENAESLKDCFTPADGYELLVKEGNLYCGRIGGGSTGGNDDDSDDESDDDTSTDILHPDTQIAIDNSNLTTETGEVEAMCPVCGEVKTWKPITGATKITTSGHWYLPESLVGNSSRTYNYLETWGGTICLHLNGKSLISTNSRAIQHNAGTLNIMGSGTVSGTYAGGAGSALQMAGNAVANLYGGTYVKDWAAEDGTALATINTAPVIYSTAGTINMYKGVTIDGSNCSENTKTAVWMHGAEATPAVFNMFGGSIKNGRSQNGGNVYMDTAYNTFNMYSGTIKDGKANYGGSNVYLTAGSFKMFSGTIDNGGVAELSNGGNVRLTGGSFEMTGGTVRGGKANLGGNIYAQNAKVTIGGTARVTGGDATDGGNIYVKDADLTISDTALISGGWATQLGGNIFVTTTENAFTMTGGTIKDGYAGGKVENQDVVPLHATNNVLIYNNGSATISGGTIEGDITAYAKGVTISGNPVITMGDATGLWVNNHQTVTARHLTLGELSEGASIVVSLRYSGAYTAANENAANYVQYFNSKVSNYNTVVGADNKFYAYSYTADLTTETGEVEAMCPVCGEVKTWKPITGATKITTSGHWYLPESLVGNSSRTYNYLETWGGTICLHLNGKSLISTNSRAIQHNAGTLNIMGSGTVSGTYAGGAGSALQMAGNAVANLYGGTYVKDWAAEDGTALATINTAPVIYSTAGTINMYSGATIDGSNCSQDTKTAVWMAGKEATPVTFNMYGGTIQNGESQNGGNVYMNTAYNTFNMYGGTIKDGVAKYGGSNVYVDTVGSFKMYGGTISGGFTEKSNGGNVRLTGGTFEMTGGTITGGQAANGGNIYAKGAVVTITGTANITDGQATIYGGNVCIEAADLTISGEACITDGKSDMVGGNVFFSGEANTFEMTSGTIKGGTALGAPDNLLPVGGSGNVIVWHNTSATISGGTIEGDITSYTAPGIKITGNPVITMGKVCGLYVNNAAATRNLILGELTDGADIAVTLRQYDVAFTVANDNVADYAQYFECTDDTYVVTVASDNTLILVAEYALSVVETA